MIIIENTLVSEDILEKQFACDLGKCKGKCCIAGDAGAPLEEDELPILKEITDAIKPYMTVEGIQTVESQGVYVMDEDGEYVTPLINGNGECAYTFFEKGIAKCAMEKAFLEGKSLFKKPISCHLYPIRIKKYKEYEAVNYEKWEICNAACHLGKRLGIPVYLFVKEALIRKYGDAWLEQLEHYANSTIQKGSSPVMNKQNS